MSHVKSYNEAESRRQDVLRQFDYSRSFEQLDPEYQNSDKDVIVKLNAIMIAKFRGAWVSYRHWSQQRYNKRGIKGRLFESKRWKEVGRADTKVMACLGRPEWMQTAWASIANPLRVYVNDSMPSRTQNESKATYHAYAAQMRILDQQIVQPIEHALQTNANDIVGGRDQLLRVALGIHHEILVALEIVYIELRRYWTPFVLSRPFCRLAESIQGNLNFKFTALQVPPPANESPRDRWFQCPECSGIVKGYYIKEKGYDMAAMFVGHLVARTRLEEVPIACANCKEEFKGPDELHSHVFNAEWESRRCWSPPAKLKAPINYPGSLGYI